MLHIFSNRTNSKQEKIRIPCPPYWSALDFWKIKLDAFDFLFSLNWIFTACVASKIQVWNKQKNQVHQQRTKRTTSSFQCYGFWASIFLAPCLIIDNVQKMPPAVCNLKIWNICLEKNVTLTVFGSSNTAKKSCTISSIFVFMIQSIKMCWIGFLC